MADQPRIREPLAGTELREAARFAMHLVEEQSEFDLFDALGRAGRGLERRVIFTTGDSMSVKTRDRLQEAARPLLKKPFNLEELREVLDRVAGA